MSILPVIRLSKLGLKLVIGGALLFGLYRLGSIDYSLIRQAFLSPVLVLVCVTCLFSGILLGGVRWWLLLRLSNPELGLWSCLRLQLIGSFFSTYLPGAAGGDLIRGAYIFQIIGRNEGRTGAITSIVIDRIFSLLGLVFVGSIASAYIYSATLHVNSIREYSEIILIMLVVSPICVILTFIIMVNSQKIPFFVLLPNITRTYLSVVGQVANGYVRRWRWILICLLISVGASGIVILGMVFIGSAFAYAASPLVIAVAGVFGNVFSAIPLTPGGIGIGETVFSTVCRELTGLANPFATIYLTFRIYMFLVNIPGGMLALHDRLTK